MQESFGCTAVPVSWLPLLALKFPSYLCLVTCQNQWPIICEIFRPWQALRYCCLNHLLHLLNRQILLDNLQCLPAPHWLLLKSVLDPSSAVVVLSTRQALATPIPPETQCWHSEVDSICIVREDSTGERVGFVFWVFFFLLKTDFYSQKCLLVFLQRKQCSMKNKEEGEWSRKGGGGDGRGRKETRGGEMKRKSYIKGCLS